MLGERRAATVPRHPDLVVAADGVHSRLRAVLFPEHPDPTYAGYITWRGLVPARAAPAVRLDAAVTETWGLGFGIAPLADGRVYWFVTASLPEGSHGDDELADLAARHRGWHAPIPQLLDATPPDALLRHDIYNLAALLPRCVKGRVALLGTPPMRSPPTLGRVHAWRWRMPSPWPR